ASRPTAANLSLSFSFSSLSSLARTRPRTPPAGPHTPRSPPARARFSPSFLFPPSHFFLSSLFLYFFSLFSFLSFFSFLFSLFSISFLPPFLLSFLPSFPVAPPRAPPRHATTRGSARTTPPHSAAHAWPGRPSREPRLPAPPRSGLLLPAALARTA